MKVADHAEFERLAESVTSLLPALEQFNRFDGPDLAGPDRMKWRELLYQPLPREAQGLESIISDLRRIVIPNGLRIGAPGFAGWVATAPTTSGTITARRAPADGEFCDRPISRIIMTADDRK
jgi:aromatic-L-amino-acid/L-tryptophan decarboxylase